MYFDLLLQKIFSHQKSSNEYDQFPILIDIISLS